MSQSVNVANIDILEKIKDPPLFEVVGNPDREDVQWMCRSLINIKANPMLWGDATPPFHAMSTRNGFAFIEAEGRRALIHTIHLKKSDKVLCLQSYRSSVGADLMETLRVHSLWLYGIDPNSEGHSYSEEEKSLMKERTKKMFSIGRQKIKYVDKPGDISKPGTFVEQNV
jgi:hypothetical protein